MSLFPIFVKLHNRKCVVVGAGKIAARKAAGLLRNHAEVVVIAPRAGGWIKSKASAGKLIWHRREFSAKDVAGALLGGGRHRFECDQRSCFSRMHGGRRAV